MNIKMKNAPIEFECPSCNDGMMILDEDETQYTDTSVVYTWQCDTCLSNATAYYIYDGNIQIYDFPDSFKMEWVKNIPSKYPLDVKEMECPVCHNGIMGEDEPDISEDDEKVIKTFFCNNPNCAAMGNCDFVFDGYMIIDEFRP